MNESGVRYRIGHGFDAHRLVEGRPFILGGVQIAHECGPLGHSDGDPLCHAISDALLGAVNQGSLGELFPETDARYHNVSSLDLLLQCAQLLRSSGYSLENLDATVVVQAPRITPFQAEIRAKITEVLQVPSDLVSIKAKTSDGLGYTGDGSGIAAYAVVLVRVEQNGN